MAHERQGGFGRAAVAKGPATGKNFMERTGGLTSDHLMQTAIVRFVNGKDICPLGCATLNMLARCLQAGDRLRDGSQAMHANNPFGISETEDQYKERVALQTRELIEKITTGTVSVISLQECDFLSDSEARKEFVCRIRATGWNVATTAMTKIDDGKIEQQPLAVLYDPRRLIPQDVEVRAGADQTPADVQMAAAANEAAAGRSDIRVRGRGVLPTELAHAAKYRGFSVLFVDVHTGKQLDFVAMHLEYNTDYKQQIHDYQAVRAADGIAVIMTGDTNHMPDLLPGLLANPESATNVAADDAGELAILDARNGRPKAYDGVIVSSLDKPLSVVSDGQYFAVSADKLAVLKSQAFETHSSIVKPDVDAAARLAAQEEPVAAKAMSLFEARRDAGRASDS